MHVKDLQAYIHLMYLGCTNFLLAIGLGGSVDNSGGDDGIGSSIIDIVAYNLIRQSFFIILSNCNMQTQCEVL